MENNKGQTELRKEVEKIDQHFTFLLNLIPAHRTLNKDTRSCNKSKKRAAFDKKLKEKLNKKFAAKLSKRVDIKKTNLDENKIQSTDYGEFLTKKGKQGSKDGKRKLNAEILLDEVHMVKRLKNIKENERDDENIYNQNKDKTKKYSKENKTFDEITLSQNNHSQNKRKKIKIKKSKKFTLNNEEFPEIHHEKPKKDEMENKNTRALSIEELRKRLQNKINKLREQRNASGSQKQTEKVKSKKKIKKLKSKLKKKEKQEQNKKSVVDTIKIKNIDGDGTTNNRNNSSNNITKSRKKRIFNEDKKLMFNKFDFFDKKTKQVKGKNYKMLLDKALKKDEKLKEVKEKDEKKGIMLEEKNKWMVAIQKAEGIKLKDDPELLKRSLKCKEKRKKRSEKKWEKRVKFVEKQLQDRQMKRKENLNLAKNKKKERKLAKLRKKGRILPSDL